EIDADPHHPVRGDVDALDHVEIGDRPADLRVVDRGQRRPDRFSGGSHGSMVWTATGARNGGPGYGTAPRAAGTGRGRGCGRTRREHADTAIRRAMCRTWRTF